MVDEYLKVNVKLTVVGGWSHPLTLGEDVRELSEPSNVIKGETMTAEVDVLGESSLHVNESTGRGTASCPSAHTAEW